MLAYFFIDPVQDCLLTIDVILSIQPNIDLLSCEKVIDADCYLGHERSNQALNIVDFIGLSLQIIMHLHCCTFVFDHFPDANFVTLLLLNELMTEYLDLLHRVIHIFL